VVFEADELVAPEFSMLKDQYRIFSVLSSKL